MGKFESRISRLERLWPVRVAVDVFLEPEQDNALSTSLAVHRELEAEGVPIERANVRLVHLTSRRGSEFFTRKRGSWIQPYNFHVNVVNFPLSPEEN